MKGKIKNSIKRFKVIFGLVCLVSLYILGKAMKTMLPPMSDYWEAVDDRFVSENIPIEANRGDLLSDDGRVLSTSLPEYRLYMDGEQRAVRDRGAKERRCRDGNSIRAIYRVPAIYTGEVDGLHRRSLLHIKGR